RLWHASAGRLDGAIPVSSCRLSRGAVFALRAKARTASSPCRMARAMPTGKSATLTSERLAVDRKVDVVVLIVAHPGFAFHELQILLQVRSARRGQQARQVACIEDHQRDADAARVRGDMKLVQMLCDGCEVD